MKTILPLLGDVQAKVDFAIGKKNHLKEFKKCDGWCREEVFFIWGKVVKMFENLLIFSTAAAFNFIANGNGANVIFLFQHFIQQRFQFFHGKRF